MRPRRILAIWTRDLDGPESVGRVNTARAVRAALREQGEVEQIRAHNLLERPSFARWVGAAGALAGGLLRGRPLPLQCALFHPGRGAAWRAARDRAVGCAVVYADGVRPLLWLRRLRRADPGMRLVVDVDDLLSRRLDELIRADLPPSLGYLEALLPRRVARWLHWPALSRAALRYERWALRHAEAEVLRLADRAVLVNRAEAALLAARGVALGARAGVAAIPPPIRPATVAVPHAPSRTAPAWRAVFVGTDALVQNRLTLDWLLGVWEHERPGMPLLICGRQLRPPRAVPGVTWAGYLADIGAAYAPGSILVSPAFLRGGIKTKVLEAFAHGVPVAGNAATFEGLDLPFYPLRFEKEAALRRFLADPGAAAPAIAAARAAAAQCLAREHAPEVFRARWRAVLSGAA